MMVRPAAQDHDYDNEQVLDISGNDNHAAMTNLKKKKSKNIPGYDYDGSSTYLDLGNLSVADAGAYTVSVWARTSNLLNAGYDNQRCICFFGYDYGTYAGWVLPI